MSITIKPFVGEWHVWWAAGADMPLQLDRLWKIVIGTGQEGEREPFLSEEYDVCVGCAVLAPSGKDTWIKVFPEGDEPVTLVFADGTLRWSGTYRGQPLRIYISSSAAVSKDELASFSLYGTTIVGDPDQVAVWGANDDPPPLP